MIIAWALFPLVMIAACLGCGLLVERVAGWRLPGTLLCPLGLALITVSATLTTYRAGTARFTTAVVLVLAVGGYVSSIGRLRRLRPDPWPLAVGIALYLVFAAPVVLSGNATFLGYFVLNDTAVHLALINQLLAHGHDISGLPTSSLSAVLNSYLSSDYPIGAQVALGALRPLVAQNAAWIFQPYLAVILSLGGVLIYQLLEGLVRSRALRALCAFAAAQPGLVYAYYLEASIKEIATTEILTLTVVLVVATLRAGVSLRRMVPLAVVSVAAFDVLNVAIAPWLGVPLAVFVIGAAWGARHAVRRASRRRVALASAAGVAVLAVVAEPVIATARTSFEVVSGVLTAQGDLGNLVTPLVPWQMLGIWPSGDFRFPVETHYRVAYALMGLAFASAVLGVLWALRRRAAAPLLLLTGSGLAAAYLLSRASPYASGKVMMIFSLAVMLTAMLGAVALYDLGRRLEAWGLAVALAAGVLWTNAVAYRGAALAPRARFVELASIGKRFAGQGPAFYNLSDEFAVDFLGAETPTDPAYGLPPARPGLPPRAPAQARSPWDPDELSEPYLEGFRLLVLGRSPLDSRPPANYRLAYRGRYYEVWRRTSSPQVLQHVAVGAGLYPAAVPRCATVMSLAARARREHARLAYATPLPVGVLVPTLAQRPDNWGLIDGEPYGVIVRQEIGDVVGWVRVPRSGRYEVRLIGAFSRPVHVLIDDREVGSASYALGPPGESVPIADVKLRAGVHQVVIVVPEDRLAPGVEAVNQTLGPLTIAPVSGTAPVAEVEPAAAHSLCGRSLEWLEVVR